MKLKKKELAETQRNIKKKKKKIVESEQFIIGSLKDAKLINF